MQPSGFSWPDEGEIVVWKAAPGAGKSHSTREMIAQRLHSGTLRHVVWAVHGTLDDSSLGAEAQQAFEELGIKAIRVLGASHFPRGSVADPAYHAQFDWPTTAQVKIISFAHLPLLYQSQPFKTLPADLLVIDESPLSALIKTYVASPNELHGPLGTCIQALMTIAPHNLAGANQEFRRRIEEKGKQHFLSGSDWPQLSQDPWSSQDIEQVAANLKVQASAGDDVGTGTHHHALQQTLREEFGSGNVTDRCCVTWKTDSEGQAYQFQLAVAVHHRLPALPPTLLLDAYADQTLYRALFPDQQLVWHDSGSGPPLNIQVFNSLAVYTRNEHRAGTAEHYRHIAAEALRYGQQCGKPVTFLGDKSLTGEGSPFHTAATEMHGHLCSDEPRFLHHHAGRGVNGHKGRMIVALTLAHLPRRFSIIQLAALFPQAEHRPQREAIRHALQRAERLQMLHRGRQPSEGTAILCATDPELTSDQAVVTDYQPIQIFIPNSSNPRWQQAIQQVIQEFTAVFGGVPRPAFTALGLVSEGQNPDVATDLLRQWLSEVALDNAPVLRAWRDQGTLGQFEGVRQLGQHNGDLLQALQRSGLTRSSTQSIRRSGKTIKVQLWIPEGGSEQFLLSVIRR